MRQGGFSAVLVGLSFGCFSLVGGFARADGRALARRRAQEGASECPLTCAVWSDGCNEYSCTAGRLTRLLTHHSCNLAAPSQRGGCKKQHEAPTRAPADSCTPGTYSVEVGGRFRHFECRQCPAGRTTKAMGAHGPAACVAGIRHARSAQMRHPASQQQKQRCPSGCLVYFNGCGTCSCAAGRALSCTSDLRYCHGRPPAPTHCIVHLHAEANFEVCPAGKFIRNAAALKCSVCPEGQHQPRPDQSGCLKLAAQAPTPPSW